MTSHSYLYSSKLSCGRRVPAGSDATSRTRPSSRHDLEDGPGPCKSLQLLSPSLCHGSHNNNSPPPVCVFVSVCCGMAAMVIYHDCPTDGPDILGCFSSSPIATHPEHASPVTAHPTSALQPKVATENRGFWPCCGAAQGIADDLQSDA